MKIRKITIVAMLFALMAWSATAFAGDYKVFGTHFAFNNNFQNSTINYSMGTNSYPEMNVSYNFNYGSLYGYPAICRGWHYGWNPANDNLFPKQLSTLTSIPCTFSYNAGGSNMRGDFAYDMFLRWDNATGSGHDPQCEVMVWGDNNSWPIGTITAYNVVTQGGITFDLWEGMNQSAGYYVYSFCPQNHYGDSYSITQAGSLNVDMKPMFDWLQNNRSGDGYINNSMYLHVIEAGLEITGGNGWAYVTANIDASTSTTSTNSYVQIQNRGTGMMIDGYGRTSNGSTCAQYGNSGHVNQQWAIESYNGNVRIRNRSTGLYLDGYGYKYNGYPCNQYGSSGSTNQQWTMETKGSYVMFKNVATGMYLDSYGSTNNGASLIQWYGSGSYNQHWSLVTVSGATYAKKDATATALEPVTGSDIKVYPNPLTDGKLKIDLSGTKGTSEIKLVDLSGKVLKQISSSDQSLLKMDVDAKPGIYMIQIINNEKSITKKLVVK